MSKGTASSPRNVPGSGEGVRRRERKKKNEGEQHARVAPKSCSQENSPLSLEKSTVTPIFSLPHKWLIIVPMLSWPVSNGSRPSPRETIAWRRRLSGRAAMGEEEEARKQRIPVLRAGGPRRPSKKAHRRSSTGEGGVKGRLVVLLLLSLLTEIKNSSLPVRPLPRSFDLLFKRNERGASLIGNSKLVPSLQSSSCGLSTLVNGFDD